MKTWNNTIKTVLKSGLGIVLVVWVCQSKMVDFSLVKELLTSPTNLAIAFLFLLSSAVLCTTRWLILVRGQGLHLSFSDLFSLTMIGSFFNTFMPGSVGGDLIKAWYIAGKEPNKRTQAVFTVILDRILGLAIIVFYAAITLAIFSDWIQEKKELKAIAYSLWLFSAVAVLSALLFFQSNKFRFAFLNDLLGSLKRFKKISKVIDATTLYRHQSKQIIFAALLSALSFLSAIYFHSFQGQLIGASLTWEQYFFVVPVAVTVSAVPLLPGGIGTGQIAFFTLFKWLGVPNPELGGTLCTIIQFYSILFNCLGYFFYLNFKRKPASQTPIKSPELHHELS